MKSYTIDTGKHTLLVEVEGDEIEVTNAIDFLGNNILDNIEVYENEY